MKEKVYARIAGIKLINFRNIECGQIDFPNGKIEEYCEGRSSVLGIYGQNASGKTSVIMAIDILTKVMRGITILSDGYVKKGCDSASLIFNFVIYDDEGNRYNAKYSFELFETMDSSEEFSDSMESDISKSRGHIAKTGVKNETIEYEGVTSEGKTIRHKTLMSTLPEFCANGSKAFGTRANTKIDAGYEKIINKNDELLVAKLLNRKHDALNQKRSFLFYDDVFGQIVDKMTNPHDSLVYTALAMYGRWYIITSGVGDAGVVNLGSLPLSVLDISKDGTKLIKGPIPLQRDIEIIEGMSDVFEKHINRISHVLSKLIPGISITWELKNQYPSPKDSGKLVKTYELFSNRDGIKIPLRLESSGIRRIISFMSILVSVYNNPSVTFAIDELDSGIFEDLLGRILEIFAQSGKGQLIFTSHNLRPLEVLDDDNIIFTTTNSENKFLKLPKRGNCNLRDVFLRTIRLGGSTEKLYNYPDEYDMELAFALGENDDEQ